VRDQSITDHPLADGGNFAGRQKGLRLPGRSLLAMLFPIFIFKTRLGDNENHRKSIFFGEIVLPQIFPFTFRLVVVDNFLPDSSLLAMD
jgi:hypothetical protein